MNPRRCLALIAVTLMLAAPSAHADDEAPGTVDVVEIYDVHDLVEKYPWLLETLQEALPLEMRTTGEGALVSKGAKAEQHALQRVLRWLRGADASTQDAEESTRARARLATKQIVGLAFEHANLGPVLTYLTTVTGVPCFVTPQAVQTANWVAVTLRADRIAADEVLDRVLRPHGLAWTVSNGVVQVVKPQLVVQIHDVSDLVGVYPWLVETLEKELPFEDFRLHGMALVGKGTNAQHRALARVLTWIRETALTAPADFPWEAATALRARLTREPVSLDLQGVNGVFAVSSLAAAHSGLNVLVGSEANGRLQTVEFTANFEQVPIDQVLDHVAEAAGVRWTVDGPAVRIAAARDEAPAAVPRAAQPTDEAALLQTLLEEVRALRAEVREIKELLTRRNDR